MKDCALVMEIYEIPALAMKGWAEGAPLQKIQFQEWTILFLL